MIKIATYNLRTGGTAREHWAKLIEDESVDLLLVQESVHPEHHLPQMLFPSFACQCHWECVEANGWGSGIFSRSGRLTSIAVPNFGGWVVGAEIHDVVWPDGKSEPMLVFSIHAPSVAESYWKQVNKILDEIAKLKGNLRIIIAGDFNLTISNSPDPDRPTSKHDLAIQSRLANEFSLINSWQTANPNQPLAQTLRWAKNKAIPYYCDGIFVPESWKSKLLRGDVKSGPVWDKLSDHNPAIATFE